MNLDAVLSLLRGLPPAALVALVRRLYPAVRPQLIDLAVPLIREAAERNGLKWNDADALRAAASAASILDVVVESDKAASALEVLVELALKR